MDTQQVSRSTLKQPTNQLKEILDKIREAIKPLKHIVVIMSGKGGVGKSVISASLALVLKKMGKPVAILDADIHGPSIPWLLGVEERRMFFSESTGKIVPVEGSEGVGVVSVELALDRKDAPLAWRGPLKTKAITDLVSMTDWSKYEYLVVDLPPGTGDEALTVTRFLSPRLSGIILVLTPGKMVAHVVSKAKNFAYIVGSPIIGAVLNMAYFRCPVCGTVHRLFGEVGDLGVELLTELPLDPKVSEFADQGELSKLIELGGSEWVDGVFKMGRKVLSKLEGSGS